jgi:hypothetical protein
MDKMKPIGYSKKDTSEMKALIERTEPKSGDYVGSGTVTTVKKPAKKMAKGGIVGKPARSYKDMKSGAGSGVGRIQKMKIQRGR